MRFTEQNYPLLRYLKWNGKLAQHPEWRRTAARLQDNKSMTELPFLNFQPQEFIACSREEKKTVFGIRQAISDNWQGLHAAFSQNIEIMSGNFLMALTKSYDSFLDPELFKEIVGEFNGTVITPTGEAICYSFEMASPYLGKNGELRYGIAGDAIKFSHDGNTLSFMAFGDYAYDADKASLVSREDLDAQGLFDFVLVYTLFKKYANIETVDAKSIRRPTADQPELKTTINGIRFLDASWYTTIIRSEGFGVRGHFRLQPCGPGRTEKKLVYINEYRKHGYVRRAKLLTEKH